MGHGLKAKPTTLTPGAPDATLSLQRLAAIVHASADAIIGETHDGIITDWNPAAERLYGYTAAEILGKHRSVLIPPEEEVKVDGRVRRLSLGESIQGVEAVRRTKIGRRIEVSMTISPIWNEAGQHVATSIIARDITERKATEAALATSRELFRVAFADAPIGMVLTDPELRPGVDPPRGSPGEPRGSCAGPGRGSERVRTGEALPASRWPCRLGASARRPGA
jgi:PAS domain S-box-containing protein